jgi:hypothetical protein
VIPLPKVAPVLHWRRADVTLSPPRPRSLNYDAYLNTDHHVLPHVINSCIFELQHLPVETLIVFAMLAGPPRLASVVCVLLLLVIGWSYTRLTHMSTAPLLRFDRPKPPPNSIPRVRDPLDFSIPLRFTGGVTKPDGNYSWVIVVPKTGDEDLEWMEREIPEAQLVVYEVDNPNAEHKIPKNKGREAMVGFPQYYNTLTGQLLTQDVVSRSTSLI